MSGKRTVRPEQFDELRQMYDRGDRLTEVAASFGVSLKTLREVLRDLAFPARRIIREKRQRAPIPSTENAALLEAYTDLCLPVQEILERFDIPLSRLYGELQKAKVPRRKSMPSRASSMSLEARSRIVKRYEEGASSIRQIAKFEGLNYDQVYVVLREGGVALKTESNTSVRSAEDVRKRFESLYADSSVAVADILGELDLTQHDFKMLLKELKLVPRGKGGGRRSIPQSVIDLMPEYARRYEAGESMAKLAEEAGIGLATMKVRLKKLRN